MVCVSNRLCCYFPCFIPSKTFLVNKQTHKLCYCYGRMCIIHLNGYFFIQFADIAVFLFIFCDQRLKAGRYKEILLFQTKLFSCIMIIIRIKNFYDHFCKVFLFDCFMIFPAVKCVELKVCDCLCIPDTKCIHNMVSISYDRHIIWNCKYRFIIFLDKIILFGLFIILYTDRTTKTDFLCILVTTDFKRIAIFEPVIRYFYLIAIFDLLFEHTVAVTDSTAVSCVSKRCKRIQEASCKTSKTTITKCRIRFLIFYHIQINAHLIKGFFYFFICSHVDQVVAKCTSHKKFH